MKQPLAKDRPEAGASGGAHSCCSVRPWRRQEHVILSKQHNMDRRECEEPVLLPVKAILLAIWDLPQLLSPFKGEQRCVDEATILQSSPHEVSCLGL